MDLKHLFDFLERLQKNNSKAWMDENRKEYKSLRADFVAFIDDINAKLLAKHNGYFDTPGKKSIERINNNLMFHPNRPTYKNHFGAVLDKQTKGIDFYFMIGLEECFIGGGFWQPNSKQLRSVREAIDYNGEELKAIINKKSFKDTFGNLYQRGALKTAPAGYSKDHEHIDLLRLKCFAVLKPLSRVEVSKEEFKDQIVETYSEIQPFLKYFRKAITV